MKYTVEQVRQMTWPQWNDAMAKRTQRSWVQSKRL